MFADVRSDFLDLILQRLSNDPLILISLFLLLEHSCNRLLESHHDGIIQDRFCKCLVLFSLLIRKFRYEVFFGFHPDMFRSLFKCNLILSLPLLLLKLLVLAKESKFLCSL